MFERHGKLTVSTGFKTDKRKFKSPKVCKWLISTQKDGLVIRKCKGHGLGDSEFGYFTSTVMDGNKCYRAWISWNSPTLLVGI